MGIVLKKDGLHGQYFPKNDPIIVAMKKPIACTCKDFYEHGMQTFIFHCQKYTANSGDYVGKYCFFSCKSHFIQWCYCTLCIVLASI